MGRELQRAINHLGEVARNPDPVLSGIRRVPSEMQGWLADLHTALESGDVRRSLKLANLISRVVPDLVPEPVWAYLLDGYKTSTLNQHHKGSVMKSLTASDRSTLIRLAARLPKGSKARRAIIGHYAAEGGYELFYLFPQDGKWAETYEYVKSWRSVRRTVAKLHRQGAQMGVVNFPDGGSLTFQEVRSSNNRPKPKMRTPHGLPARRASDQDKSATMVKARRNTTVKEILLRDWDAIHDLEAGLEFVQHLYSNASSYPGEGKKDSTEMARSIQRLLSSLRDLSNMFDQLIAQEKKYIRSYGTPADYTTERQKDIFPR